MKKLGVVYSIVKDGLIIVESSIKDPLFTMGAQVFDSTLRKIGFVFDIIGKVEKPYIVVKPYDKEVLEDLKPGSTLYYYKHVKKQAKPSKRGRGRGK